MSVQAGELGSAILCFFWFYLEKSKKTKKKKIARPMSVQAGELGSAILFFFLFFLVVLVLPREIQKKQKNQNCKTYVGTSW